MEFEYALVFWISYYQVHVDRFESMQKRVLKAMSFKMDCVYLQKGYRASSKSTKYSKTIQVHCPSFFRHSIVNVFI